LPPLRKKVGWPEWVEPKDEIRQATNGQKNVSPGENSNPQPAPLSSGHVADELSKIVLVWTTLPKNIRAAILTLIDAAQGGQP
jgi:hypothetical protein